MVKLVLSGFLLETVLATMVEVSALLQAAPQLEMGKEALFQYLLAQAVLAVAWFLAVAMLLGPVPWLVI
jgi:hypothetical protein